MNGDEVVVAPGTYFEAIDFIGKAITLRSSGGAGVTTIDGTGNFHVVQCVSGEGPDTVLDGFTISGGNANGNLDQRFGGGMFNDESSPTVNNCIFSGNTAEFGGGMFNDDGNPMVINCTFTGNTATTAGGGVTNVGEGATFINCVFNGNSSDISGGGMSNHSLIGGTVTDCIFSGNTANRGSGMFNFISSPTVHNCIFIGNPATVDGGGMANITGSNPTVTNCAFHGNSAISGGGMFNDGTLISSSPTVTNCTFTGNTAIFAGGAVHNTEISSPTVTNCTFSGNTADFAGGGMWNMNNSSAAVANSIFRGNVPDQIVDFDTSSATVLYSDIQGGFPGTGNIDADPLFVDPDNGDYRLQPGSPCIDAADNTAVPEGITTDLDGNPRFVDDLATTDTGNGECPTVDMGSYEFPSSCPWDLDCDGNVAITDFLAILAAWGTDPAGPPDFDGGGVGITDFLELLANWGPCP